MEKEYFVYKKQEVFFVSSTQKELQPPFEKVAKVMAYNAKKGVMTDKQPTEVGGIGFTTNGRMVRITSIVEIL